VHRHVAADHGRHDQRQAAFAATVERRIEHDADDEDDTHAEAKDFAPTAVRCALDVADVLQVHDWDPMDTKTGIVSEKLQSPKPDLRSHEKNLHRHHSRSYFTARPRTRSTG